MAEDSTSTDELEEDPLDEEDTPDESQGDTEENNQQAQQPDDVETLRAQLAAEQERTKNLQAWNTRNSQRQRELEDRILATQPQGQQPVIDPADPLAAERAALEAERRRISDQAQWNEITATTPPEFLTAYGEFQRGYALDPSPRGAMNAFGTAVVTLATRLAAAQAGEPPKPAPSGQQPPTKKPRVDTSRSDAPDPEAIDKKIAGAKDKKDLRSHVSALLDRASAAQRR